MTNKPVIAMLHLWSLARISHAWTPPPHAVTDRRHSLPILQRFHQFQHHHQRLHVALSSEDHETTQVVSDDNNAAKRIYSLPALYDLAFGFRDYDEEAAFLLQAHRQVAHFAPRRILDVAAGPARHALAALMQPKVAAVTCLDQSPDMARYAQELADEALGQQQRDKFQYVVDDMRSFALNKEGDGEQLFDTAWILLGSLQHLTHNDDVVRCFQCVHKSLRAGGTLIVELPHPRESTFGLIDCTRNAWTVPLQDCDDSDAGELQIVWGDADDAFDPIAQVRQLTIEMKLTGVSSSSSDQGRLQSVKGTVPTRLFTAQEMHALAALGGFRVAALHGALEEGVSVHDEDAAFRLVCVLQKPP